MSSVIRLLVAQSDQALVVWLCDYSGVMAGYYPGMRRQRVAAEREAARRGLEWWLAIITDDGSPRIDVRRAGAVPLAGMYGTQHGAGR